MALLVIEKVSYRVGLRSRQGVQSWVYVFGRNVEDAIEQAFGLFMKAKHAASSGAPASDNPIFETIEWEYGGQWRAIPD